jgi:hypothetical protein
MKQTSVEWLVDKVLQTNHLKAIFEDEINQAKEMEKQQIIDARVKKPLQSEWDEAEQYYNEQFKNK